jgi:hypothetical protein
VHGDGEEVGEQGGEGLGESRKATRRTPNCQEIKSFISENINMC